MLSLLPPYKAIVVFTPAGDVIYTVDNQKTQHWHFDLCLALQSLYQLPDPPHFLVPSYTATLDVSRTHSPHDEPLIHAEIRPRVYRYRYFLNALFQLQNVDWIVVPDSRDNLNPVLWQTYQNRYSPLWQPQNWVVSLDQARLVQKPLLCQVRGDEQDRAKPQRVEAPSPEKPRDETPAPLEPKILEELKDEPEEAALFAGAPLKGYVFRLFVSGYGTQTERNLQDLHFCLKQGLKEPYSLKIIDIAKEPELAEQSHITAIPTLIRVWPPPHRRIVGHFQNPQQLLQLIQKT